MNNKDLLMFAPPAGTRRFDPNMDRGLVDEYAEQSKLLFEASQRALLPPEMSTTGEEVRFTPALFQIRNLTAGTSEFHITITAHFAGMRVERDNRKIAGVTPDDKLLFQVGRSAFLTMDGEKAFRKLHTEHMSKMLKASGHGGDLSKLITEELEKNGLKGLFDQNDPDDWWKQDQDGPAPPES